MLHLQAESGPWLLPTWHLHVCFPTAPVHGQGPGRISGPSVQQSRYHGAMGKTEVWGHLGALFCWDGRRVSNDWTSLGHGVALWFCACVCLSGCPDLAVPPLWLFLDSG